MQLHLYFCIYWYLLILIINLLPLLYLTFYVPMIQSIYWRFKHCKKYKKLVAILFIHIQCIRDESEKRYVNVKKIEIHVAGPSHTLYKLTYGHAQLIRDNFANFIPYSIILVYVNEDICSFKYITYCTILKTDCSFYYTRFLCFLIKFLLFKYGYNAFFCWIHIFI